MTEGNRVQCDKIMNSYNFVMHACKLKEGARKRIDTIICEVLCLSYLSFGFVNIIFTRAI